jgi:hypothetical protein
MSRKLRKNDVCEYVGPYEPEVTHFYGPGRIVGFRQYGRVVTVRLLDEKEELYADWPIDEIRLV